MRIAPLARYTAIFGVAALVGLFAWLGTRAIGREVLLAAWAIPPVLALHAAQLLLSAIAWRSATGCVRPSLLAWWRIRWIREAVNSMLPVAQIGGNILGVRLLATTGMAQARAAAGTVVDLTMEAASQAVFTFAGVAMLAAMAPAGRAWSWFAGGALALTVGVGGFVAAQRFGLFRLIEAAAARFGANLPRLDLGGLAAIIAERWADRRAVLGTAALHLLAWLLGVGETLLALIAMHHAVSLGAALVIEALGMAARSAAFAIPGALGVQEAGFVLVGGLFGLPAEAAVALSMVKRVRELLVGIGGVMVWQSGETWWRTPRGAAGRGGTEIG